MNGRTEEERKILLSHISDLKERAYERNSIQFSDFLTEEEQADTTRLGKIFLYGGYKEAERKIAVFLPDYLTMEDIIAEPNMVGITYLLISLSDYDKEGKISHRDILGALMNIGIKRETLGDIISFGNTAVAVIKTKVKELLLSELKRVGRYAVSVITEDRYELHPSDDGVETKKSVASLRLDGIISAFFNLSRNDSAYTVTSGLVSVNGIQIEKVEKQINVGDRISLRGKGRIELISCDGRSSKGRIIILAKIFK